MIKKPSIIRMEKFAVSVLLFCSIIGGLVFGYITAEIKNFSGIDNLKAFQPSIPTRLYDVNGDVIAELFQEKRDIVQFSSLPQCLINAFIATEDQGFYDHFGISPISIIRAMGKNFIASIKRGKPTIAQGGSTITQQLAKRLFTSGERTFARKALEAVLAFQIEKRFTKDEILEMYFNQIYLGHGCHGISTATRFYFNKDVKDLSVAESAVLAVLPSKPTGFSPIRNPNRSSGQQRETLSRMVDCGFIDKATAENEHRSFWPPFVEANKLEYPTKTALSRNEDRAPYFTDFVRQVLVARFGREMVYNEGLNVYTTLDLKRQAIGEKHLVDGVRDQDMISQELNSVYTTAVDRGLIGSYGALRMVFPLPGFDIKDDDETRLKKELIDEMADTMDLLTLFSDATKCNNSVDTFRSLISNMSTTMKVEGALVGIEPHTGYITTMVGGSEFEIDNQYNRALQARRQPGSAFKPFVYGAAVESKMITTRTYFPDAPIIDIDSTGDAWEPGNYEGDYKGMVPVENALSASINIISIRIFDIVGADAIMDFASRMSKVPVTRFTSNPTLALGTSELTPFEMANAYAIYANRGRDVIPFCIRYVTSREGKELVNIENEVGEIMAKKFSDGTIQVVSEGVAWIMTQLMMGVVDRGTAVEGIRIKGGYTKKAAGKTGTTSNWSDAWFCGFTPELAAVVWVGYDRSFISLGKHQAGAGVAAPIWARYMRDVYKSMRDPEFPPMPEGVSAIGGGYGLTGAHSQYFEYSGKDEMKTVMQRYMEIEGLTTDNKDESQ
jgi:penicillin-binding protein 1A